MAPGLSEPVRLDTDIVALILEFIHDTSPRTLSSVALTCRTYATLARYSQHRTVVLPLRRAELTSTRLEYVAKHDLLPAIREVVVKEPGYPSPRANNALLGRLLPKMSGLCDFTWPWLPIPQEVLKGLEACPEVCLHASFSFSEYPAPYSMGLNALKSLVGVSSLSSLAVKAEYTDATECLAVTQPLKHILLTCRKLQSLRLDVGLIRSSGCVVYDEPSEYCGFGFADGERPPALCELCLIRYPFGEGEEQYWADVFDWSRLTSFRCTSGSLAKLLAPRVIRLRNLALENIDDTTLIARYNELPSHLEGIGLSCVSSSINEPGSRDLSSILLHGEWLRSLRLGAQDLDLANALESSATAAINHQALILVGRGCPFLEELSVALARDASWPLADLDVLKTEFPFLRRLSLWFDWGPPESPAELKMTFEAAADLFKYLRKPREGSGQTKIEMANLYSGWLSAVRHGDPNVRAYWPGTMHMRFLCKLAERDDERATGRFYVSCLDCPELHARDDQLEEVVQKARAMMEIPSPESRRIRIAVDGPVPIVESGSWYPGLFD